MLCITYFVISAALHCSIYVINKYLCISDVLIGAVQHTERLCPILEGPLSVVFFSITSVLRTGVNGPGVTPH